MLLRLTLRYLRPYKGAVIAVFILQLLQVLASLGLPSLNASIIDNGVVTGNTGHIWRTGAIMLTITAAQLLVAIGAIYFGARTAMRVGLDLRHDLFIKVQKLSRNNMHLWGAPSLITRVSNDIQQVQMLVLTTLTIVLMAPFMGIGGVFMALQQDVKLSALLLVVVPILALVIGIVVVRLHPLFKIQQTYLDRISTVLREQLTGVRVIRAFVRQETERKRFEEINSDLRDTALKIGGVFSFLFPALTLIINISSIAVIWFGGIRAASGDLHVGSLIAYISYLMQIFMSIMLASMMLFLAPRAQVCATRIEEVLAHKLDITSPKNPKKLGKGRATFTFEDVQVQFPGAQDPVLTGISLTLEPGTTTAVIGSTGSGKSTLIALPPRFLDVSGGRVSANGIDVRDLSLPQLRERIAFVPQKSYLFSGSIAQSISGLSPDKITEEIRKRVEEALKIAQSWDFVCALEGGIDAEVSPSGTNFSGGQRQRLAIARALYRDADLYLFDDSFSALDTRTEARLRAALAAQSRQGASLIVSQRVSSVREADQIVVLDQGKIVGHGTHNQLLHSCEVYAQIVASQERKEEEEQA